MNTTIDQKQNEKILHLIKNGIIALKDPDRLKIVNLLWTHKSLFYSEIKDYIKEENPNSSIAYHLEYLKGFSIIKNKKGYDKSSGKARTSVYQLTEKGKMIYKTLVGMIDQER